MRVQSLGWEDPLATYFSILAWKTPWTEDPGGLQSIGLQRVGQDLASARMHTCMHSTFKCQPTALVPVVKELFDSP